MEYMQAAGGLCAPQGFKAAGLHCGIAKNPDKKDLGMIYSSASCSCAAVFTRNKVKAAPVTVTRENVLDGIAQAVIVNSGNANACNPDGEKVANEMCKLAGTRLGIRPMDVVVASTGVIGQPLSITPIENAIEPLYSALSDKGSIDFSHAIMTTDLVRKEIAISFEVGGKTCKMGAAAKGSGMIHPNMGTMLCFITTDVNISPKMLNKALRLVCDDTFNMVSVDGDSSTNDTAVVLANGLADNRKIEAEGESYDAFVKALLYVCIYLARMIARDGEGATKLLECSVSGAPDDKAARALAKSVISSSLFKAAMFGEDANWGRVLCALGYAPAEFDPKLVSVSFASRKGEMKVCEHGAGVSFSEEFAKQVLAENEIEIKVDLHQGEGKAVAWGCDLTYDYVKINGDYRS